MDDLGRILTAVSVLIGILGSVCLVALPVLLLLGPRIFLQRRNQQSNAFRQAAQSRPSATGKMPIARYPVGAGVRFTSTRRIRPSLLWSFDP